jgi:hypothetical protein
LAGARREMSKSPPAIMQLRLLVVRVLGAQHFPVSFA